MDKEKKQPEGLDESAQPEEDLISSGTTWSSQAQVWAAPAEEKLEIQTDDANRRPSEAGPDSTEPGAAFTWEELKHDSADSALSQAAQDLADYSKLNENDSPPAPPSDSQPPPEAKAGLGNRMAWTVAGGLVLAGFLTWVISAFTLKMPYWVEALITLLMGAGWLGLGLRKFKLPTVVGGLALIWTLGMLLGALYGLPGLTGAKDQAIWEQTLLFLAPVGLFSLTTLGALWGLFLVIRRRVPRLIGLVVIIWSAIPLIAAYYSIRAGHREASFTEWLSSPVDFLSGLPWFLSPAFFTLLLIPAGGFLLWLARQVILFKTTKINRHFGPLWLALSFLVCLLLGGVYLENVFQKNLGLERWAAKAAPWVNKTSPDLAGDGQTDPSRLEAAGLQNGPTSGSFSPPGVQPEPDLPPAPLSPAEPAPDGPQPVNPSPGAREEALIIYLEKLEDKIAQDRAADKRTLELLENRLDLLERLNQSLLEDLRHLQNRLDEPETGGPGMVPLEPEEAQPEKTETPPEPGSILTGPPFEDNLLELVTPKIGPALEGHSPLKPEPAGPQPPGPETNREPETRPEPEPSAPRLKVNPRPNEAAPTPKTKSFYRYDGQLRQV